MTIRAAKWHVLTPPPNHILFRGLEEKKALAPFLLCSEGLNRFVPPYIVLSRGLEGKNGLALQILLRDLEGNKAKPHWPPSYSSGRERQLKSNLAGAQGMRELSPQTIPYGFLCCGIPKRFIPFLLP